MRVLVVGSGGREHALAWAIAASPLVDTLYCAPGNAGIAEEAECVADRRDRHRGAGRVLPPRADRFRRRRPRGAARRSGSSTRSKPRASRPLARAPAAAALEGSKAYAKDLCVRAGIPTAAYRRFRDAGRGQGLYREPWGADRRQGRRARRRQGRHGRRPISTRPIAAVDAALVERRFGAAGLEIVVEDFLAGEEASFFALVDGKNALPLATAQDYKRVGDGDTGPNTGGMGACSPTPRLDPGARRRGHGAHHPARRSRRWSARAGPSRASSTPG